MDRIEDKQQVTYDNSYKIAAVVYHTRRQPDRYIPVHSKGTSIIVMAQWDEVETLLIMDIDNGLNLVDPVRFGEIHREVIKKILQLRDKKENNHVETARES